MKRDAREMFLQAQTEAIYALLTGSMRLPDPALAVIFGTFRKAALSLSKGSDEGVEEDELITRMGELEGYFRESSPLSEALRKMILDARPSQMKSIIRGYLVNYVYEW